MIKFFSIFLFLVFCSYAKANDPFTQEIGIIKEEPEIVEVIEEEAEPEVEEVVELENLLEDEEEIIEEIEVVKVVEKDNDTQEIEEDIVRVINIDPLIAYSLKQYTLKGTALSKESKHKFKRANIKKIDLAKVPTTHTIEEGETIEKIAFRYGFSLREIEIANAIYPGSRPLIVGDKLVIPNRFHIVKEGQSLNSVAARYNIDPIQLASFNNIGDEDIVLIGDKLLLPFFIHVTNENETISDIAGRYEREVSELINFNKNLEEDVVLLNENQLIKIPIYANQKIEYANLSKKSINDFKIDRKNLAIIEIEGGQYMVREGDRIGNKDGVIVSIDTNLMIVLEENLEYEFLINTPIVGQAIASMSGIGQTGEVTDALGDVLGSDDDTDQNNTSENQNNDNNDNAGTITNVEDLFN